MKLSVLDQSVIAEGENGQIALENTVKLAQITEELGYVRFWVAEHHNTNGIAGTSPEILISHIASSTKKIRVGSGGVLLPQYSPYKVAENFKVLESLFPNRIDLGIGRSPGGAAATRLALTDGVRKSMNGFPRQVKELTSFLTGDAPEEEDYKYVTAYPHIDTMPETWLLGLTHRGARVAAENGTAFTYGQFINPNNGTRAIKYYYNNFQPSSSLAKPKVNICIFVVCASTQEKAEEMAISLDMWLLAVEKGMDTRVPSLESAKKKSLTKLEKAKVHENRKRMIVGNPEKVKEELLRLSEFYETEEFMVITNIHGFDEKVRSYNLLAEALR